MPTQQKGPMQHKHKAVHVTRKDLQRFWLANFCLGLRVKTILFKRNIVLVGDKTEHLRKLEVLVTRDLTAGATSFWAPRRASDRRTFSRERRARFKTQKTSRGPSWTGEPRPQAEHVPLSSVTRDLSQEEIRTLCVEYGFPMSAMVLRGSLPRTTVSPRPKTREELGEIVPVKTPPSEMPYEQRMQLEDHNRLMAVFQKSRLDLFAQDVVYSIVVLGKSVREAAEASGLSAKSLAVTVSRIRGRMY
jgi:hypothetical protein